MAFAITQTVAVVTGVSTEIGLSDGTTLGRGRRIGTAAGPPRRRARYTGCRDQSGEKGRHSPSPFAIVDQPSAEVAVQKVVDRLGDQPFIT